VVKEDKIRRDGPNPGEGRKLLLGNRDPKSLYLRNQFFMNGVQGLAQFNMMKAHALDHMNAVRERPYCMPSLVELNELLRLLRQRDIGKNRALLRSHT
jgi:hypothetical protein